MYFEVVNQHGQRGAVIWRLFAAVKVASSLALCADAVSGAGRHRGIRGTRTAAAARPFALARLAHAPRLFHLLTCHMAVVLLRSRFDRPLVSMLLQQPSRPSSTLGFACRGGDRRRRFERLDDIGSFHAPACGAKLHKQPRTHG